MTERNLEHYRRYGWKCNEDNLRTLPSTAPEGAKALAEWLTLEGRRSSLAEWLPLVTPEGRIHGKFWHIGAWTQRKSHSSPNQANIPRVWDTSVVPSTPVEQVKANYDHRMRECFEATPGWTLIGTDADGIQLRILCHYMESVVYRDALVSGDKSTGTDIHSLNQRALGPVCKSRDDAKTFIYAWILGAGIPKLASILGCTNGEAATAVNNFLSALPELLKLKTDKVVRWAKRGYFVGLDGRRVKCTSSHLMLAGLLQEGESTVMKLAALLWHAEAKRLGLVYRQVNDVHDEWQTEVAGDPEDVATMQALQCEAIEQAGRILGLFCPLEGSTKTGRNWRETH